ncbi:hypothetical protein SmJEL517_g03993 [Synchytrium microbalum]|uniref:FAD dependent oxidoreductase domain-containing protein n=1 Tax=Synchytrium microbalum TaxID=1806994 RepID=A0A507C0S2_9FUNG|nr:uncharacterized protein SmJEL517_g03993 [Synchytrium microbalum]TPX32968.1 hypothetical protein SmJEL517_g03993 [Synchytrium microbalum]
MNYRAGLPAANSTKSYWLREPNELKDIQTSEQLQDCDVVIIGAGITGVSCAYHLNELSPTSNITILEARGICEGATGRNGGHLTPNTYRGFTKNAQRFKLERWTSKLKFEFECASAIRSLIATEKWEEQVELTSDGNLHVFFSESEAKEAQQELKTMQECGLYGGDFFDADLATEMLGTRKTFGGVFNSLAGHFWPAKLVYLMARKIIALGVQVHANTPVIELQPIKPSASSSDEPRWTVTTPRGTIRCKSVIHCTNGYVSSLVPSLTNRVIPVRGQVIAAEPPASVIIPPFPFGLSANRGCEYAVWRRDNVVVLGGGREVTAPNFEIGKTDDNEINEKISKRLRAFLRDRLSGPEPCIEEWTVLNEWTGIMGYTEDALPWVGPLGEEGQFVSVGFHGHGMPVAFHCAKAVAQQVLGQSVSVPGFTDIFLPSRKVAIPGAQQRAEAERAAKLGPEETGVSELAGSGTPKKDKAAHSRL